MSSIEGLIEMFASMIMAMYDSRDKVFHKLPQFRSDLKQVPRSQTADRCSFLSTQDVYNLVVAGRPSDVLEIMSCFLIPVAAARAQTERGSIRLVWGGVCAIKSAELDELNCIAGTTVCSGFEH